MQPELEAVAAELDERASRAGVALAVEGDPAIELEIRPRMVRVVAQNLAENAIRYAGPGATFTLAVEREADAVVAPRDGRRRSASRRRSWRGSSSGSSAPTGRAPRAARGSASRS